MSQRRIGLAFAVPCGFFLFALGYIAFTLSLDVRHMIGDQQGYDPGSRFMPLAVAILLAAIMLLEMVRSLSARRVVSGAQAAGPDTAAEAVPVGLLVVNIAAALLFVALFRPLGFMLATALLLYGLIFLNLSHVSGATDWRAGFRGLIVTLGYTIGLYTVARGVIRSAFLLAREYGIPLARDPNLQALAVTAVVALVMWLAGRALRRLPGSREWAGIAQTTTGVTLGVYIVFRLLFTVQLPAGLLTW